MSDPVLPRRIPQIVPPYGAGARVSIRTSPDPSLPASVRVAATVTHRWSLIDDAGGASTTTNWIATAFSPTVGGAMALEFDMVKLTPFDRLPDVFVVGDGSSRRAPTGVDKRPGTRLYAELERLADVVRGSFRGGDRAAFEEHAIAWCRDNIRTLIDYPHNARTDGGPELPWDRALALDLPALDAARLNATSRLRAHANTEMPVAPLEAFLDEKQGYCLQMALLAVLLLQKLNVPAAVRHVSFFDPSSPQRDGHVDVKLDGPRVLDPAWRVLQMPGPAHTDCADSEFIAGATSQGYRYPIQSYVMAAAQAPGFGLLRR